MKDKVSLYKPLNFFMFRTPVFTSEFFDNINFPDEKGSMFNDSLFQKVISLAENPIIREAVNVASTSLINAIDKLKNEKDIKKKEQIILNFLKYLIRMSTRPTPFGLFSGVTSGDISDSTKYICFQKIIIPKTPGQIWNGF
jgi:hypothetical protein